ncbi:MAG: hypothetical protein R3F62_16630 [Planctomycetota bacterium]
MIEVIPAPPSPELPSWLTVTRSEYTPEAVQPTPEPQWVEVIPARVAPGQFVHVNGAAGDGGWIGGVWSGAFPARNGHELWGSRLLPPGSHEVRIEPPRDSSEPRCRGRVQVLGPDEARAELEAIASAGPPVPPWLVERVVVALKEGLANERLFLDLARPLSPERRQELWAEIQRLVARSADSQDRRFVARADPATLPERDLVFLVSALEGRHGDQVPGPSAPLEPFDFPPREEASLLRSVVGIEVRLYACTSDGRELLEEVHGSGVAALGVVVTARALVRPQDGDPALALRCALHAEQGHQLETEYLLRGFHEDTQRMSDLGGEVSLGAVEEREASKREWAQIWFEGELRRRKVRYTPGDAGGLAVLRVEGLDLLDVEVGSFAAPGDEALVLGVGDERLYSVVGQLDDNWHVPLLREGSAALLGAPVDDVTRRRIDGRLEADDWFFRNQDEPEVIRPRVGVRGVVTGVGRSGLRVDPVGRARALVECLPRRRPQPLASLEFAEDTGGGEVFRVSPEVFRVSPGGGLRRVWGPTVPGAYVIRAGGVDAPLVLREGERVVLSGHPPETFPGVDQPALRWGHGSPSWFGLERHTWDRYSVALEPRAKWFSEVIAPPTSLEELPLEAEGLRLTLEQGKGTPVDLEWRISLHVEDTSAVVGSERHCLLFACLGDDGTWLQGSAQDSSYGNFFFSGKGIPRDALSAGEVHTWKVKLNRARLGEILPEAGPKRVTLYAAFCEAPAWGTPYSTSLSQPLPVEELGVPVLHPRLLRSEGLVLELR